MPVSLEKLEQKAPELVSLAKTAQVTLAKVGLPAHTAKVSICLDISGSMIDLYRSGKVQRLAEKALALGALFDDDGAIDVFVFDTNYRYIGEMSLDNFRTFVREKIMPLVGGGTNYAPVIHGVRKKFFPNGTGASQTGGFLSKLLGGGGSGAAKPTVPVYCFFVTDGENFDRTQTEREMVDASNEAIFWQFMGIGRRREDFPFLAKLDDLRGRTIDNANFFVVGGPDAVSDDELYSLMLTEYPGYVTAAKAKGILA